MLTIVNGNFKPVEELLFFSKHSLITLTSYNEKDAYIFPVENFISVIFMFIIVSMQFFQEINMYQFDENL